VSQQTIARWERGGQIPAKYLKDLAVLLGARVEDFIGSVVETAMPMKAVSDDDSDIPFGGVNFRFIGDGPDSARSYPVTEGEWKRLLHQLGADDDFGSARASSWIKLETLDNRWVIVNAKELVDVTITDDDVEAMPSYFHPEVYNAAREFIMRKWPTDADLAAEDYPYSTGLMEKVNEVLAKYGGPQADEAFQAFKCLSWELTSGEKVARFGSREIIDNLHSLFNLDYGKLELDRFLMLPGKDDARSCTTHVRLGALRCIEVPLLLLEEVRRDEEY